LELTTGYLPTLLQLYATDVFAFGTKQNGWLIFMYSMLRGVFLTFAFPKLISVGRTFNTRRERASLARATKHHAPPSSRGADGEEPTEREPLLGSRPPQPASTTDASTDEEDIKDDDNQKVKKQQTFTFDLTYTRGYVACPLPCLCLTIVSSPLSSLPHLIGSLTHPPLPLRSAPSCPLPIALAPFQYRLGTSFPFLFRHVNF
jgi:hypothetical protein